MFLLSSFLSWWRQGPVNGDEASDPEVGQSEEQKARSPSNLEAQSKVAELQVAKTKNVSRWQAAVIMITNEVGIGILSLSAVLKTLGFMPGMLCIVLVGLCSWYSAYVLVLMFRKYPRASNIVDMARLCGGSTFEWAVAFGFVSNISLICASANITMSIGLNTISNHAICTVGFIAIPILVCWLSCVPRTMRFVSYFGWPCTISIVASVIIVMVSLGVKGPQRPEGAVVEIQAVGNPTFPGAVSAILNIAFAYSGNVGYVTIMAEMRDASLDFPKTLLIQKVFVITIYLIVAAVIYSEAGQFVTSPALGAAPIVTAQVAYGIIILSLLGTGLVFGHTAIKYIYYAILNSTRFQNRFLKKRPETSRWFLWLGIGVMFWVITFIIANVIPVFDSILTISASIFLAWFTFGISGVFWLHLNWGGIWSRGWKTRALALVNWGLIALTLFFNSAGMYASIDSLVQIFSDPNNQVNGPFTCAENSIRFGG